MCSGYDPEEKISVVQLNSELRHAHLELVSAHCAVHQLRLRYSFEELAQFGRRDVLRKSAEAATALHEFYRAIDERIPNSNPAAPSAQPPSGEQIMQAVQWVCDYLRLQRDRYLPKAKPLAPAYLGALKPYFPAFLLNEVRVVELNGDRVAVPDFFEQVRALGYDNLPDIPHMESITFLDVVAFNEKINDRALFHALVHSVQMRVLGLERYSELWVRSFLKTRAHFTVPLEVHAFSLASKFLRTGVEEFSVTEQVLHWAAANRY